MSKIDLVISMYHRKFECYYYSGAHSYFYVLFMLVAVPSDKLSAAPLVICQLLLEIEVFCL